jgi:hypothetical protein
VGFRRGSGGRRDPGPPSVGTAPRAVQEALTRPEVAIHAI